MQRSLFKQEYNYCLDASVLIRLSDDYPPDVFAPLWRKLESLVGNGYAHAPREVLKELQIVDDDVSKWAKQNRHIFRSVSHQQIEELKKVLKTFPNFCDFRKEVADADPFLVAHALCEGCVIVTDEKPSDPAAKIIKIPNVCQFYNIKCISLIELFREQKWKL